jgi:hypothetical protein
LHLYGHIKKNIQDTGKILNNRVNDEKRYIQKCCAVTEEKVDDNLLKLKQTTENIYINWQFKVRDQNSQLARQQTF